jgi:uncharacterized protein YndB with AHSA1/START domain
MVWLVVTGAAVVGVVVLVFGVGSLLPRAHSVSRMAHFNRSPREIWMVISDFSEQSSWRDDVRTVERVTGHAGRDVWRETDKSGRSMDMETVELVPPRRLVRRIANDNLPFSGTWTMEVAEFGEVTALTVTEDGEIDNPAFRFISRFIMGQTATIDQYLRALGKKLGADVTITTV